MTLWYQLDIVLEGGQIGMRVGEDKMSKVSLESHELWNLPLTDSTAISASSSVVTNGKFMMAADLKMQEELIKKISLILLDLSWESTSRRRLSTTRHLINQLQSHLMDFIVVSNSVMIVLIR